MDNIEKSFGIVQEERNMNQTSYYHTLKGGYNYQYTTFLRDLIVFKVDEETVKIIEAKYLGLL